MARNSGVALRELRSSISDGWLPELYAVVDRNLAAQVRTGIPLAADGRVDTIDAELLPGWIARFRKDVSPFIYSMFGAGYDLGEAELGRRDMIQKLAGGKARRPFVEPELLPARVRDHADRFIEQVTKTSSDTTAKQLADAYAKARTDPELLTPAQTAKALRKKFATVTPARANSITRTTTIWTYNGGARDSYADNGVRRLQWLTTSDDLACEYCEAMNGRTCGIDDGFNAKGDSISGTRGGSYEAQWNLEHPPLHQSCRCVIVPM